MSGRRLIVIGAGAAGLAAASGAVRRGWDVTVLERDEVGASLRQWGPTRFFSPLAMNLAPGMAEALGQPLGHEAILTGAEYVDAVLAPLAGSALLQGRVLTSHRVIAVGREGLCRTDYARHPLRHERPFRALVESPEGERYLEAEAVIDASGCYGQPLALGAGGLAAPGEAAMASRIVRHLGQFAASLAGWAGRHILVIGHGHSAANAILLLAQLAEAHPETRVTWAVRTLNRRPCVEVASDPLPERHRVVFGANQLAANPPQWLRVERRASVCGLAADGSAILVTLTGGRSARVDAIASFTGYRPDLSIVSELALRIDPATEGAAGLSQALANVTDCLSVPAIAPGDLDSGEPRFYLAGAKSYGRSRSFLLQNGFAQIETMLDRLGKA
ncbi:MAG: NAD(P)-binding domain-containing protein [Bryobacterales bacterium]|nr:NAD(P)-binding domain-containing protein [Bryobacterales bacterium]